MLAFQFGVLVMGISDAFAGSIGERYGKKKFSFLGLTKSIEGSITFFIITLVIITIFRGSIDVNAIIITIFLTVAECLGVYGSDNLILPILGACLYYIFL
jgi:phytol kinase